MKRPSTTGLAIALTVSVGANAYVLLRDRQHATRGKKAPRSGVIAPQPISILPDDIDQSQPCEPQLEAVRLRLDEARAELVQRLSPSERFDQGAPDTVTETEARVLLGTVFADAPAEFRYQVECRTRICKVSVTAKTQDYVWPERLQGPTVRSRWSSIMFEGNSAYVELSSIPDGL